MTYEIGAMLTSKKSISCVVDIRNGPGGLTGVVTCYGDNGKPIRSFQVTADLRQIRNQVMQYLSTNAPVGWGWNPIKRAAKAITKKVGAKRILRTVKAVVNDPRFKKGMMLASTVYPPLGITYGQMQASAKLLEGVKARDPDAVARMTGLVTLANEDNLKAAKILTAMRAMIDAAGGNVAKVSGIVDKAILKRFGVSVPYERAPTGMSAYEMGLRG